ncbi:NusG domain II-containing protein [bacterium]|nr:NusG domain II-containing protein [bacterium]
MKRRNFLKNSFLALASVSFCQSGFAKVFEQKTSNFELSILTQNPELAKILVQTILKPFFPNKVLSFQEFFLPQKVVGDLVWVENFSLVNYKNQKTEIEKALFKVAQKLKLPSLQEKPTLIKISDLEHQKGSFAKVTSQSQGTKIFELNKDFQSEISGVTFEVKNNKIKILHSTCKHKICTQPGEISQTNEKLICIPNCVSIQIFGKVKNEFDAFTL